MDKFSLFLESDRNNLLKAIFAHPFERTPKLVLADWLDENGREREAKFIRMAVRYQAEGNSLDFDKNDEFHYLLTDLQRDLNSKNVQISMNRVKYFKNVDYYQVNSRGVEYYTPQEGLVPVDIDEIPEDILEGIVYYIGLMVAPVASSEWENLFHEGIVSLNIGLTDGLSKRGIKEVYSGIRSIFLAMRHDPNVGSGLSSSLWPDLKRRIRGLIEHLNSNDMAVFVGEMNKSGINMKDLIIDLKVLLRELPNS